MTMDAAILHERVAAVTRQIPLAVLVTIVNAGLMAGLLANMDGDGRLLAWLAATLAIALLRMAVWWLRTAGQASAAAWGAVNVGAAALAGLAWGAGAALLWPDSEALQLFWVFVIGGMCAGAATLHHVYLPAAIGFILPAGLPVVIRMAMDGSQHGLVGAAMILVYLTALIVSARRSSRHFGETLRLRLDLAHQTRELDAARAQLAEEINEHRATEATLRHAQKLEAVGQLAGGIAHDFNNILQAVASGAALIRRRASDAAAVARLAGMVADAARRGESITRRLLTLSRRGELRAEALDLHEVLHGLRDVLAATLHPGIRIEAEAPGRLPPVMADRGQLETALVNLAVNARDAMPEGGTLALSAALEQDDPGRRVPGLAPGRYVRLVVADTGTGMDDHTLARATEPFFTTKPQGRGTGLGLSMVRSFAEGSGGALLIESAPGCGTRASIWLPLAAADMEVPAAAVRPVHNASPRLLLVDDEPAVLAALAQELADEGCEVATAADGAAALALLDAGAACDVIVTDLAMPGLDGVAVIREARKRRPALPAILLTGYAGEVVEQAVACSLPAGGPFALLRKPVGGVRLADQASALLEAGRTPPPALNPAPGPPA